MNVPPTSPSQSSESGNDEAATAVLMSLLEVNNCNETATAVLMSLLEVKRPPQST